MLNLNQSQPTPSRTFTDQIPVLWITCSLHLWLCEGPRDPLTQWKYTQLYLLCHLWAWCSVERSLPGKIRLQLFARKVKLGRFLLVHPRTFIGGRYVLVSSGKGAEGGWLKWPIRKTPIVPTKNTVAMAIKQNLSITRAARNHSSFSWIYDIFPVIHLNIGWIKRKTDPTFWKLLCCLAVSAICLHEATHFFTSGEAFARLTPSCSAVPSSSPSSVCKRACIYSRMFTDEMLHNHSRSFSSTDFISPFLSLSLENMSSDRAVFIEYSSALVMSVMELRRRQGTRNISFPSVVRVSRFLISEAPSLLGIQRRICIFRKRGRTFKRTWRLTQGQRIIQGQTDSLPCQRILYFEMCLVGVQSHLSDRVCHYVSAGGPQGHIEDYHTVHHHHRGHWHHKHQIPAMQKWMSIISSYQTVLAGNPGANLLGNKRHRFWCLRNLLSYEEQEDSLAQEGGYGHGALLATRCRIKSKWGL